jgi:6-phosphogluconate dehydrogenase
MGLDELCQATSIHTVKQGIVKFMAQQFGVIGLAVMGENLALNVERNGFPVAVYNRTASRTEEFMAQRAVNRQVRATFTLEEFVAALERPRRILMMVQAGPAVDKVIESLQPLLESGDILIDGGNSLYEDTALRTAKLETAGFQFIGMGVSGGEEGALNGPSLMPGGTEGAYKELAPILTKIAAQVNDGPCVTYIGPGGAGHFVKMVHNGIEYGDMQLIAEAYDLLKSVLHLGHEELQAVFHEWNQTEELNSFLVEITANIFKYVDPDTQKPLVELIKDAAGQKGTGSWTVESALKLGVSIPTITAAVNARVMSSYKDERVAAAPLLPGPTGSFAGDRQTFIAQVRDALYCSKICSYAQGMALIAKSSSEFGGYEFKMSEIARIWKGGCIIRAEFLDKIRAAYDKTPPPKNLLLADEFRQTILERQGAWRHVLAQAAYLGIPVPAFSASLDYFDSYRRDRLPQNLTQAQRDYFGAHTYERIDRPGETFHTEWIDIEEG